MIHEILSGITGKTKTYFDWVSFGPDRDQRESWHKNGWVLLKGVVSPEDIARANSDLTKFRSECGETKDEYGYGQRIGLFHVQSEAALQIALNKHVQGFLRWAFSSKPILFGSLSFEAGTEQEAHRDNIFFYTEPLNAMAGAWIALEDVNINAGPLFYYNSSHLWSEIRTEHVLWEYPELTKDWEKARANKLSKKEREDLVAVMGQKWHLLLANEIRRRRAQSVPVIIKKGDVLLWHSLLVHGGMVRKNRRISRRSMVVHYLAEGCGFWDNHSYFLLRRNEFNNTNRHPLNMKKVEWGTYCVHEKPVTY